MMMMDQIPTKAPVQQVLDQSPLMYFSVMDHYMKPNDIWAEDYADRTSQRLTCKASCTQKNTNTAKVSAGRRNAGGAPDCTSVPIALLLS